MGNYIFDLIFRTDRVCKCQELTSPVAKNAFGWFVDGFVGIVKKHLDVQKAQCLREIDDNNSQNSYTYAYFIKGTQSFFKDEHANKCPYHNYPDIHG